MQITINDDWGNCWKFYMTEDMNLVEILECIEQQIFYDRKNIKRSKAIK